MYQNDNEGFEKYQEAKRNNIGTSLEKRDNAQKMRREVSDFNVVTNAEFLLLSPKEQEEQVMMKIRKYRLKEERQSPRKTAVTTEKTTKIGIQRIMKYFQGKNDDNKIWFSDEDIRYMIFRYPTLANRSEENLEEKLEELSNEKAKTYKPSKAGVVVKGIDNCLVKLSKCCNPVPGDEIIGYITKGRGVSVHRKDCVNTRNLLEEENRIIDVYWDSDEKTTYNVDIEIYANDRSGLLAEIIAEVSNAKCNLIAVNSKATKEKIAITEITVEIPNIDGLNKVLKALRKIDSVYEVRRKK